MHLGTSVFTLIDINTELERARAKFPRNRHLLTALMEEVGKLAKALLQDQGAARVRAEAVQIACLAIRIIEEGDETFRDLTEEEKKT